MPQPTNQEHLCLFEKGGERGRLVLEHKRESWVIEYCITSMLGGNLICPKLFLFRIQILKQQNSQICKVKTLGVAQRLEVVDLLLLLTALRDAVV